MKKLLYILAIVPIILGLYSCLDDEGFVSISHADNFVPVVSLYGVQNGRYSAAIQISPSEEVALTVAAGGNKSDLTVTFVNDGQAAVDQYNDELAQEAIIAGDTLDDGTPVYDQFVILPPSVYSIPSMSITIPAGANDTDFILRVNSSAMDVTTKYVLPLTIASVSGDDKAVVADNLKTVWLYVQLKNKYDGVYTLTGTMVDATSASLTGYYPWQVALVTNGADQVVLYDTEGILGSPGHVIKNGTSFSQYGNFGVIFNFDPATGNVTSVQNYYVDPAPRSRTAVLDPTGVNNWDAATKTLKVKYWLNQAGAHRTSFDETYKFKRPR